MGARHRTGHRRIRVAFVEQHALVLESFGEAVRSVCTPCPVLVRPGASRGAVAAQVLAARPHVAVLHLDHVLADEDLPIEQLAKAGVATTVLTDRDEEARLGGFIDRGAEAALSTAIGLQRLVHVIHRVSTGEPGMTPHELDRLRSAARASRTVPHDSGRRPIDQLSVREGQVLRQLMAGVAPAEIARRSYVAEATVRTQVRAVLTKLGVGSQLAAVAVAYRAGWIPASVDQQPGLPRSGWSAGDGPTRAPVGA